MPDYDVIVIGTGVAGRTAAPELAAAGKKVALVDCRDFGGTCALRGCEPKKTLFAIAETVERAKGAMVHGVDGRITLDWSETLAFKDSLIAGLPERIEASTRSAGIEAMHGTARFVGGNEEWVEVAVGGTVYSASHVVVATGARPAKLGIPGETFMLDSEALMSLPELPAHIVFVGGGYIAFEFAHMAHTAGAEVSIVHRGDRVLEQFDADLTAKLAQAYRDDGIDVRTGAGVDGVEWTQLDVAPLLVRLANGEEIACDGVVHAAGRAPDLDALDLEAANVSAGRRGIEVDGSMRSVSNPRVFAVGDAADLGAPLTPPGIHQARVAVRNIVEAGSAVYDPAVTASVAFADPPLASVGLSEAAAREAGLDVEAKLTDMTEWDSTKRAGVRTAAAKTVIERGSGRILGAHLLGPAAPEVINVFALAIAHGLTRDDLLAMEWSYPTGGWEIVYLV
jgi:glutathione reductase (NADPH)